MNKVIFALALAMVFAGIAFFSLTPKTINENNTANFSVVETTLQSEDGLQVTHHSHPTKMSLQGKVEGLLEGDLGVKVSDLNSCISGVLFDQNFSGAIKQGLFNVLLGDNADLNLNYNKDYYICLYVNGQQVGNPSKFRGGQGQIHSTDVNALEFGLLDGNNTWNKKQTFANDIEVDKNAIINGAVVFNDFKPLFFGSGFDVKIFADVTANSKRLVFNKDNISAQVTLSEISFNDTKEDVDVIIKGSNDASLLYTNAGTNRVGFSTASPDSQVEIEARTNSIGVSLLRLDQDDEDQPFITYEGSAAGNGSLNINTDTNLSHYALLHFVKVDVNGVAGWMPVYTYTG